MVQTLCCRGCGKESSCWNWFHCQLNLHVRHWHCVLTLTFSCLSEVLSRVWYAVNLCVCCVKTIMTSVAGCIHREESLKWLSVLLLKRRCRLHSPRSHATWLLKKVKWDFDCHLEIRYWHLTEVWRQLVWRILMIMLNKVTFSFMKSDSVLFECVVMSGRLVSNVPGYWWSFIFIIIIICEFIRRTMSTRRLNLRRQQSLGGDDGSVKWKAKGTETFWDAFWKCDK